MVKKFLEHSNNCATNVDFIYAVLSGIKSAFAERNISSLKNIIKRYLEENWTYFYIDQLDQFVNTSSSRVISRVTKLAPNKVTKNEVSVLVSLIAQRSTTQKPMIYVGDFVRIVKKKLPGKVTSNSSQTKSLK